MYRAALIATVLLFSLPGPQPVTAQTPCLGDCNRDGSVHIAELITAVGIALGRFPPSRCDNLDAAFIDVLIRAVRNSLNGCPTSSEEDFSSFTRFDFLRGVAFGYCPPVDSTMAATIRREDDGSYTLKRSIARPGDEGVDACLVPGRFGGPCTIAEVEACRTLTEAEVDRVRSAFSSLTLFPGPTPLCGVEDPCLEHRTSWDGVNFTDDQCGERYLPAATVDAVAALLDDLGAGPERPCPSGLCRNGDAFLCNDGNDVGGDGCSANCADEHPLVCALGSASSLVVQDLIFPLSFPLAGAQSFSVGVSGGQYALALAPEDFAIDPVPLPGIGCLCLRGHALRGLGANLMGAGVIECGAAFEPNAAARRDRNTTPGHPFNLGGLADDRECDDESFSPFSAAPASTACLEGVDPGCGEQQSGVCRGPLVTDILLGEQQPGSGLVAYNLSIDLLGDGGICSQTGSPASCAYPTYGPDCRPCTDDDLQHQSGDLVVTVTGTATGTLYDARGAATPADIEAGRDCGSSFCGTSLRGMPFDCAQLAAGELSGDLVGAWPRVGDVNLRDAVVRLRFACRP